MPGGGADFFFYTLHSTYKDIVNPYSLRGVKGAQEVMLTYALTLS